jgi:hypothetical protein
MTGPRIPQRLVPWFEARRRLKLSHTSVQMARELGMNPAKLDRLRPAHGEAWKAPLDTFIAHCYQKAFGRSAPLVVRSLEDAIAAEIARKEARRARKEAARLGVDQTQAGLDTTDQ